MQNLTARFGNLLGSGSRDTLGKSGPPSRAPAVASSKPDESDALVTFRTITTMLSKVQQESVIPADGDRESNLENRKRLELRLLNALSTVMVIENEVVAVVANHSHPSCVDILACPQADRSTTEEPKGLWELLVNRNPRRDSCETQGDVPEIRTPVGPAGLSSGEGALLTYIDECW